MTIFGVGILITRTELNHIVTLLFEINVHIINSSSSYMQAVSLHGRGGLVDVLSLFFVWKKNGTLRLVLDCRQVNQVFKDPPGVSLGSLSALGNLEIRDEDVLYVSQADIKDCFWHCLLPHELARFFCMQRQPQYAGPRHTNQSASSLRRIRIRNALRHRW